MDELIGLLKLLGFEEYEGALVKDRGTIYEITAIVRTGERQGVGALVGCPTPPHVLAITLALQGADKALKMSRPNPEYICYGKPLTAGGSGNQHLQVHFHFKQLPSLPAGGFYRVRICIGVVKYLCDDPAVWSPAKSLGHEFKTLAAAQTTVTHWREFMMGSTFEIVQYESESDNAGTVVFSTRK